MIDIPPVNWGFYNSYKPCWSGAVLFQHLGIQPRVYSGLNAKVLEQHRSTPTSVVKPKVCILNRTPGLPGDIYA